MKDVWGDPVIAKTTPAGHRCRVALGRNCVADTYQADGWEMRVTDPDDDLVAVFCTAVFDGDPVAEVMREYPESFWAEAEATLMANFDDERGRAEPSADCARGVHTLLGFGFGPSAPGRACVGCGVIVEGEPDGATP